jgi:hypothetical protein
LFSFQITFFFFQNTLFFLSKTHCFPFKTRCFPFKHVFLSKHTFSGVCFNIIFAFRFSRICPVYYKQFWANKWSVDASIARCYVAVERQRWRHS